MLKKTALLVVFISCVSANSFGGSYFKQFADKSKTCADGHCVCDDKETCCEHKPFYLCCPLPNGICCAGTTECCPSDAPICSTCGDKKCCVATETKCCGGKCCDSDSFPSCVFGFCVLGKDRKESRTKKYSMTKQLHPDNENGPSGKCIEVTLGPETPGTGSTKAPSSTTRTSTTTPGGPYADCAAWRKSGFTKNGIYQIKAATYSLNVYCDMTTDGGGWVVFQRRQGGMISFMQNWANYTNGFGEMTQEFYLGNSHISDISLLNSQTLRIDLTDCTDASYFEVYPQFSLSNERTNFTLNLNGNSTGTAGDSIMYQCPGRFCQNQMQFTTFDRDNDHITFANCAVLQAGGWWYNQCGVADLNGQYYANCVCTACNPYQTGIFWFTYKNNAGNGYSFKKAEMKMRPASFIPSTPSP